MNERDEILEMQSNMRRQSARLDDIQNTISQVNSGIESLKSQDIELKHRVGANYEAFIQFKSGMDSTLVILQEMSEDIKKLSCWVTDLNQVVHGKSNDHSLINSHDNSLQNRIVKIELEISRFKLLKARMTGVTAVIATIIPVAISIISKFIK